MLVEGVGYFLCHLLLDEVLGGFVEGFGQFGKKEGGEKPDSAR